MIYPNSVNFTIPEIPHFVIPTDPDLIGRVEGSPTTVLELLRYGMRFLDFAIAPLGMTILGKNEAMSELFCYNLSVKKSMKFFWNKLPTPFTVLAPMDGVTDMVFRQMVTQLGKPDVLFTEFVSCDGLMSIGRKKVEQGLLFKPNEQPLIAQIWGSNPKNFYESAKHVKKLGFSGIDINMGCPHRPVIKNGACSALIKNQTLATEIIKATKEGAGNLPVSVKTRTGFEKENIEEWIGFLLKQNLAALTVHLHTVAELSKVPAHWELMPRILEMRDKYGPETVLVGNGEISSLSEIKEKYKKYGCEGFMIGRGIFANPWVFSREKADITVEGRFEIFLRHIDLHEQTWGNKKNYANLKKFCKAYINNFPGAAKYREKIMEARSLAQLRENVLSCRQQVKNSK